MNYKSFNLGDWIGHISGVIEDETTLDGNEMMDLVEFLTTLTKEPILDKIRAEIEQEIIPRNSDQYDHEAMWQNCGLRIALKVIDKYRTESEE